MTASAMLAWAGYVLGRALGYREALRHVAAANALKRAKRDAGGAL